MHEKKKSLPVILFNLSCCISGVNFPSKVASVNNWYAAKAAFSVLSSSPDDYWKKSLIDGNKIKSLYVFFLITWTSFPSFAEAVKEEICPFMFANDSKVVSDIVKKKRKFWKRSCTLKNNRTTALILEKGWRVMSLFLFLYLVFFCRIAVKKEVVNNLQYWYRVLLFFLVEIKGFYC